jgi:hypothetical protein
VTELKRGGGRYIVASSLAPAPPMRTPTRLVGREEELDLLGQRWERARKGEGQLRLRLFQRPSSHFQSRRGGVRL